MRATDPNDVDDVITQMIETPGPVIVDMVVTKEENCFPMIPGGAAHNEVLLGLEDQQGTEAIRRGHGPRLGQGRTWRNGPITINRLQ